MMQQVLANSAGSRSVSVAESAKPSEHELIALAQTNGELTDYAAYLSSHPSGVFADLAKAEIAHIVRKQAAARRTPAAAFPAPAPKEAPPEEPERFAALTFDLPIEAAGGSLTRGRTLRELTRAFPHFPPIEGLDASVWKDKACSSCHNWSMSNLCDQGKFYGKAGDAALKRKKHPYGGEFKMALSHWAEAGCR